MGTTVVLSLNTASRVKGHIPSCQKQWSLDGDYSSAKLEHSIQDKRSHPFLSETMEPR